MPDPRFDRLKTDPRFRKPRRKSHKVVIDERFKSIFDDRDKRDKGKGKVDKYGRKVSRTHDSDNLRRFYRLEDQEEALGPENTAPDYARGEGLMESSDEGEQQFDDSESDGGEVILGRDVRKPITVPEEEPEIDLDESQFAELDALAAMNAANANEPDDPRAQPGGEQTSRLAVVNLDWDHVRASHLFKIFSSVLSPSDQRKRERGDAARSSKGKVLNVRVYPSEFGKKRLAWEQHEGPPKELFKKRPSEDERDMDDDTLLQEDDGNEYDEEALRKYQLERLRYYYAIVACDTVDAAAHIYSELDGSELERSANLFDLSFVPKDMVFDDEPRDEATQGLSGTYKGVEFVTDALRHSRVKLTWDDDDPERQKITRRTMSQKEIEESDFKAYLASSGSSDGGSDIEAPVVGKREKMRALLLGGNDDDNELLPEGWGQDVDKAGEMEITFTPGLSGSKDADDAEEETTLQQYLRKQKERRKRKKVDKVEKKSEGQGRDAGGGDEFFGEDSDGEEEAAVPLTAKAKARSGVDKPPASKHVESTPAELALLLSSAEPSREPKHFDMRSVAKAEKAGSKKRRRKDKNQNKAAGADEDETQEGFAIDVKDDRFKALHEDHHFAIDPSNPRFKKTKSMVALLDERAKRQRDITGQEHQRGSRMGEEGGRSLKSLVESVKRKSGVADRGVGKRRRL